MPPKAIEPLAYYRRRAISEGPREGVVVDASELELQQYLFDLRGYLVILKSIDRMKRLTPSLDVVA
jgi:hypothetical protein